MLISNDSFQTHLINHTHSFWLNSSTSQTFLSNLAVSLMEIPTHTTYAFMTTSFILYVCLLDLSFIQFHSMRLIFFHFTSVQKNYIQFCTKAINRQQKTQKVAHANTYTSILWKVKRKSLFERHFVTSIYVLFPLNKTQFWNWKVIQWKSITICQ